MFGGLGRRISLPAFVREDSEGSKVSGLSSYQVVELGLELEIQCPHLILCVY